MLFLGTFGMASMGVSLSNWNRSHIKATFDTMPLDTYIGSGIKKIKRKTKGEIILWMLTIFFHV